MRTRSPLASPEARALLAESDVLDLHIDAYIWVRALGYDIHQRNSPGWLRGALLGQVDVPRVLEGGFTGATWVITTNPLRTKGGRRRAFERNLQRMKWELAKNSQVTLVRNVAEYRAARAQNKHAAFLGIQGGNALDESPTAVDMLEHGEILRVTLVHLSNSTIGTTSAPSRFMKKKEGLTSFGQHYVERLNHMRVAVDLAHIDRKGFFDALEVHDKTQPVWVTHTGVDAVRPHWRNVDDEQIKAVADTGGIIGVIYQGNFLRRTVFGASCEDVVNHLEHLIQVGGEDVAALGSDWDGFIIPPHDLKSPAEFPNLVDAMLRRGWKAERIQKVLGGNFLRSLEHLRG